jgi:hypothetical protein
LVHDPFLKMVEVQAHFALAVRVPDDDVHGRIDLAFESASERVVDVVALAHDGGDGDVVDVP